MDRSSQIAKTVTSLFLAGLLIACTEKPKQTAVATPAASAAAGKCAALAQQAGALGEPTARIVSAKLNPAFDAPALHSADPGAHFRAISAVRKAGLGLFRRDEFDQAQGLRLPSSQ